MFRNRMIDQTNRHYAQLCQELEGVRIAGADNLNNSLTMLDLICLLIPQEIVISMAILTDTKRLRKLTCEPKIEAQYRRQFMKYPG